MSVDYGVVEDLAPATVESRFARTDINLLRLTVQVELRISLRDRVRIHMIMSCCELKSAAGFDDVATASP